MIFAMSFVTEQFWAQGTCKDTWNILLVIQKCCRYWKDLLAKITLIQIVDFHILFQLIWRCTNKLAIRTISQPVSFWVRFQFPIFLETFATCNAFQICVVLFHFIFIPNLCCVVSFHFHSKFVLCCFIFIVWFIWTEDVQTKLHFEQYCILWVLEWDFKSYLFLKHLPRVLHIKSVLCCFICNSMIELVRNFASQCKKCEILSLCNYGYGFYWNILKLSRRDVIFLYQNENNNILV